MTVLDLVDLNGGLGVDYEDARLERIDGRTVIVADEVALAVEERVPIDRPERQRADSPQTVRDHR